MTRSARRTSIAFRDMLFCVLCTYTALVVLMVWHLNPPTEGQDDAKPAGNVIVEARWPDALDVDVDLWVRAPGDKSVGYANSRGIVFDLLRDDLGFERDGAGLNYEFAFSRGAPDGEYVITVNLYSNRVLADAVPVVVHITASPAANTARVTLASRSIVLTHAGHDVTVARFTLADGRLVAGSVHDTPVRIRP